MTIFLMELKRGKLTLIIWALCIAFMLGMCIVIFPEMVSEMPDLDSFGQMGDFSAAFGMDQLNFAEFIGYFGIECGNVLGIGGAFFAAILGISALAKEEKEHTAEFLLTHPVGRVHIIFEKLCAVFMQIIILNAVIIAVTALSIIAVIDEDVDVKKLALIFLAFFCMQIEIASITFAISAFLNRGGMGIGIGFAAISYFMNIIANITEEVEFLKYITPYGYTDSAYIIKEEAINTEYLSIGILITIFSILIAFIKYSKKDMNS